MRVFNFSQSEERDKMKKYQKKLIEAGIEGAIITVLAYLFYYQNYLLHKWYRGLPLPSKIPFMVAGILTGAAYFIYKLYRTYPMMQKEKIADVIKEENLEAL
ncbi:MAG: Uncharacterized protein XD54_2033 [Thermococcus sibiricus]|jgi:hypothetical protein|uniref:Uncharacterized protein n=2 Tax=Thermococcaceae TaxID=2259 RepID=A0A124FF17_9EURY|nr:MAG: Uncharacterized protein XD54_2033 [Thermococcus sibiricus]MDK2983700.1 hypothetical protein [Thermococcaceae archaeon]